MSFFRPEAMAAVARWREVIVAAVIIALGLWIAARPGGMIVTGFGYVLIGLGAVAMVPAVRRARFITGGDGPGVVQIDEGRILFMGPETGGAMALDDLSVLSVRRTRKGDTAWVLADATQLLVIPVDASGADALFDAFAALPGLNLDRLIASVQSRAEGSQRLWARDRPQALTR
ncbi:hypothetical protein KUL25_13490 [Rhodobacteraceae bacterium N5(2021)]|uniref:Uncharacterized protein n=1 Tax=Gymnodinialimonas phycosphaerae TaxID=2841589 RepID=A0A975TT93_9RHOB|nr:hypothetical protein [Gymnodinialimonas phycosphaerae]MBY4893778.1 hypothetical protein [Gymnodinialimonas phycosphaerae]